MQKLNHSLKLVCIAENRLCRQSINGRRNSARINAVTLGGLHIPRTADLKNYTVIYVQYCGIAFQSDRAKSKYCTVKCFADARRKENRI